MKKALCIVGPTASGKTALAYNLARKFPSVIINADSRHVYKELTIIAGKDLPENSPFFRDHDLSPLFPNFSIGYYLDNNTKIYLMDIVNAEQSFSVAEYQRIVEAVLNTIPEGVLPIIVGGSHFYVRALYDSPQTFSISPDLELRSTLKNKPVQSLQAMLSDINTERFESMNNSDKNNPRRLIRAIEVAKSGTRPLLKQPVLAEYATQVVGLVAPLSEIREKIDIRVDTRLKDGAVREAESLFTRFATLSANVKSANGYKELMQYLAGECIKEDAIQKWRFAEYHNAKKQLTWIRGDLRIQQYSISDKTLQDSIIKALAEAYQ
jgi:tRNA dimethylallyltransferase